MTERKQFTPIKDLINLTNRKAIVTGGAMGIGYAIAYRLAESGATVTVVDSNREKGDNAVQLLTDKGFRAFFIQCDVSQEEEVKNTFIISNQRMGSIDILVNNAGIYPCIPLVDMSVADYERIMAVNMKGVFLFSREVCQRMLVHKNGGSIINIASVDALHPSAVGFSAYDSSKGAVAALTRSLALEFGKQGIRVNAIAPGVILTEGAMTPTSGPGTTQTRSQLRDMARRIAIGRMGIADDIGRVALFLASGLSDYMIGSLVVVDGGYLIG